MPDIKSDSPKSIPSMQDLTDELSGLLSSKDLALLNVLRRQYDNQNFLSILKDKEAEINSLGVLSHEEWIDLIDKMNNSEDLSRFKYSRLLPYFVEFYDTIQKNSDKPQVGFAEDHLAALYYQYGMMQRNKFLSEWFEFNLNVNNTFTALTCRKQGWNIRDAVVGNNHISQIIRNSTSARDFNLKSEFEYFDSIAAIAEVSNLLEREHRIDMLKWEWLEAHTVFEYFSIERILSFWLKCQLMHRWDDLSVERGTEIFRNIIDELRSKVKF